MAKLAGIFFTVPAVTLKDMSKLNPVYSIQTAWIVLEFCSVPETLLGKTCHKIQRRNLPLTQHPFCPPDFGRSKFLEEFSLQNTADTESTEN